VKAFRSMVAGVVLVVAALLMASPTSAAATSSVAAAPAAPSATSSASTAALSSFPFGCTAGYVCFYRSPGAVNLCGKFLVNGPNLGSCANLSPSGSIVNNGTPCSGCQDVLLYYNGSGMGTAFTGAAFCLQKGHYLLDIKQNVFNRFPGAAGYGQPLAFNQTTRTGGVASARWTSCS